jgi:hypothetical protein
MKKILFLMALFFSLTSSAKKNLVIRGSFEGLIENTDVVVSQYSYEDVIISKTTIKDGVCIFNNLPRLQDGVYQIIINYPYSKENNQKIYSFNIIIDNSESSIEFTFNPSVSSVPTFTKSSINNNWYEFLKLQNFHIELIADSNNSIVDSNNTALNAPSKFNERLEKESKKLNQMQLDYLKLNFNKWSNYLVKNHSILSNLAVEDLTKEKYWFQFDTNNPDLINTPIYQEIIRNYMVRFYSYANEEDYKIAFEEIIAVFSRNEITKKWIVKYLLTGLYKINNSQLLSYFHEKYH